MTYNILDVLKDIVLGRLDFVDANTKKDRYNICLSCEARNKTFNTCTVCGCYLPAKTKLKKAGCPMELW